MYQITFCYPPPYKDELLISDWLNRNNGCWIDVGSIGVLTEEAVVAFKLFWPDEQIFEITNYVL